MSRWVSRSIRRLVPAVAVVVGLAACSGEKAAEQAAEKVLEQAIEEGGGDASNVDVDVNGDGDVAIKGANGETINVSADGQLPESWPAEVPKPSGIKIDSALDLSQGDTLMMSVGGKPEGDGRAFVDGYVAALTAAGFKEELRLDDPTISYTVILESATHNVTVGLKDGNIGITVTPPTP